MNSVIVLVTNSSEQNSSKQHSNFSPPNSRVDHDEQLSDNMDMLKVTGAAYIIQLIRDFFYLLYTVIGNG